MVDEKDLTPDLGAADLELDPLKFFSGEKLTPDQAAQELDPLGIFPTNAADEKPVEPPLASSTAEAVQKLITAKSRRSGRLGPKHRLIKATNQSSQDPESSELKEPQAGPKNGELFFLEGYASDFLTGKKAGITDLLLLREIDSIQVFWSERNQQYELEVDDRASQMVHEIVADYNSVLGLDPRDQVSEEMWTGKAA